MDHGLQMSLKSYELSMEDKMAAAVLGALRIMGEAARLSVFIKGAVSSIIPSTPKCSSRHFIFHRKGVCFE